LNEYLERTCSIELFVSFSDTASSCGSQVVLFAGALCLARIFFPVKKYHLLFFLEYGYYCQLPDASPGVYRDPVKTTFGTPLAHYPKLPPSPVFWSSRSRVQLLVGQKQVAWLAKSLDADWSRTPTHPVLASDAEGDIHARVELG
jgi:hypothetical protein